MPTVELTAATFEQAVSSEGPHEIVLLDFWASWCGPCMQFAPTYEAAAERHPDITFAKVNTEEEQELAAMAQIQSIPTLMAFRQGICVFSQAGALPPAQLEQLIEAVRGLDMDAVRAQMEAQDEITLDEFAARHASRAYVIDVREDDEWARGHVADAVHIPMNDVPSRLSELPTDQTIHVICQSGGRSRGITDYLRGQGLDAVNVAEGTGGWAARGWALSGD